MELEKTKTILVADDSEFFRVKVSDILTQAGYRVKFARDGVEVIAELRQDHSDIDLLILDLQMPNINGFEVLRCIKTDNLIKKKLPVLVITGVYETSNILKKLKDLGASGLITKAATTEQLLFRVNKLLFKDKKDVRIATRIPTTIPVDFTTYDHKFSTGFMLNLSKTGAFIYTNKGSIPGDTTHLKFSLPCKDKIIEVDAEVIWVNRLGEEQDNFFKGMGVHFTKIEPEDREIIILFVKQELERLK